MWCLSSVLSLCLFSRLPLCVYVHKRFHLLIKSADWRRGCSLRHKPLYSVHKRPQDAASCRVNHPSECENSFLWQVCMSWLLEIQWLQGGKRPASPLLHAVSCQELPIQIPPTPAISDRCPLKASCPTELFPVSHRRPGCALTPIHLELFHFVKV